MIKTSFMIKYGLKFIFNSFNMIYLLTIKCTPTTPTELLNLSCNNGLLLSRNIFKRKCDVTMNAEAVFHDTCNCNSLLGCDKIIKRSKTEYTYNPKIIHYYDFLDSPSFNKKYLNTYIKESQKLQFYFYQCIFSDEMRDNNKDDLMSKDEMDDFYKKHIRNIVIPTELNDFCKIKVLIQNENKLVSKAIISEQTFKILYKKYKNKKIIRNLFAKITKSKQFQRRIDDKKVPLYYRKKNVIDLDPIICKDILTNEDILGNSELYIMRLDVTEILFSDIQEISREAEEIPEVKNLLKNFKFEIHFNQKNEIDLQSCLGIHINTFPDIFLGGYTSEKLKDPIYIGEGYNRYVNRSTLEKAPPIKNLKKRITISISSHLYNIESKFGIFFNKYYKFYSYETLGFLRTRISVKNSDLDSIFRSNLNQSINDKYYKEYFLHSFWTFQNDVIQKMKTYKDLSFFNVEKAKRKHKRYLLICTEYKNKRDNELEKEYKSFYSEENQNLKTLAENEINRYGRINVYFKRKTEALFLSSPLLKKIFISFSEFNKKFGLYFIDENNKNKPVSSNTGIEEITEKFEKAKAEAIRQYFGFYIKEGKKNKKELNCDVFYYFKEKLLKLIGVALLKDLYLPFNYIPSDKIKKFLQTRLRSKINNDFDFRKLIPGRFIDIHNFRVSDIQNIYWKLKDWLCEELSEFFNNELINYLNSKIFPNYAHDVREIEKEYSLLLLDYELKRCTGFREKLMVLNRQPKPSSSDQSQEQYTNFDNQSLYSSQVNSFSSEAITILNYIKLYNDINAIKIFEEIERHALIEHKDRIKVYAQKNESLLKFNDIVFYYAHPITKDIKTINKDDHVKNIDLLNGMIENYRKNARIFGFMVKKSEGGESNDIFDFF